ncbi:hypothetical protein [Nocardioides bruguierae]|uniref:Secreted protein n=1 Tax=Nocardioides bruguierae TaxID=2945102 RepID=A0A9X2D713_9ACTN|nr:hypothetical protein [Nocardioides bruguierae]MCL8025544.1 hypothetical protein [Nocardioides bruguierae]MCM0620403.1 hypothetical protein [Nocardioides bruguierae]
MTALTTLARRAAAVLAVLGVAATGAIALAAPASAEVPVGWSDPDPVDPLHFFLVVAGVPLVLALVIVALTFGPALARGERVLPGSRNPEHEWLGGPDGSPAALTTKSDDEAGGTSARW